ncbi:MAG: hypothetical protein OXI77_07475 [Chloroflexota bacterium]|nr:hypothetical protein [Chloroflexota bacterium]MDE2908566.1 hypothetical protein [Chloroflexota bacterium]
MVLDTTETRQNRVESDIETLRTTQANILDHLDSYLKTLNETRDIAAENRDRLDSIGNRQKQMEDRQKRMEDRQNEMANDLKRNTDRLDSIERVTLENSAAIHENRIILLSLATSMGLTIEKPGGDD